MKGKFILITNEQEEFITSQSKRFNLSKFVRDKLDVYVGEMKILRDLK